MMNLNYLMVRFLYQIFRVFQIYQQNNGSVTDNSPLKIYVNKLEKRVKIKIKTEL